MWPFSKQAPEEPDTRPASPAALAVAKSLKEETARWRIGSYIDQLVHDSGIVVNAQDGWIRQPNLYDEPEANAEVIREAADAWVAARLALPVLVESNEEETK
jgi:hypothetical protein